MAKDDRQLDVDTATAADPDAASTAWCILGVAAPRHRVGVPRCVT